MADNYLEKRMADYRAGRLKPGVRHYGTHETRSALIFNERVEDISLLATELRRRGWRVAFCCSDRVGGTRFAQTNGCRFYPFNPTDISIRERSIVDLSSHWGFIDCLIDLCDVEAPLSETELEVLLEKVNSTSENNENNA